MRPSETKPVTVGTFRAHDYHVVLTYWYKPEDLNDHERPYWASHFAELPGVLGHGATPDMAVRRLMDAFVCCAEMAIEDRTELEEPFHQEWPFAPTRRQEDK